LKVVDCVFINLDSAAARRVDIEASFAQNKGGAWTLTRFPAVPASDPRVASLPGGLRPAEKACFLSHRLALASRIGSPDPVLMLEDDAVFGPHTAEAVDRVIFSNEALGWDLFYTDICVPLAAPMIDLAVLRRKLEIPRDVRLINLRGYVYAGATAYIVNPHSIAKVVALLDRATLMDMPYDLYLRREVNAGRLNAYAFFPFLTSLSVQAEDSQVQAGGDVAPERVWNLFRRMTWIDRDLAALDAAIEALDADTCDAEARAFGTLFGAMASGRLPSK
jgi:GR25 family glycosyltransferase involved in LPS biosynthesis